MLSAVSFLTVFGRGTEPTATTLRWFPFVGAVIGAALAGVLVGARALWSVPIAAAVVVAADLALTGALHLDGLADSADGLLPHLDRERRLDVMRRPDVGAFAAAAVGATLLLRWSALTEPGLEPLALVGIWAGSRTVMAAIGAVVPYARAEGGLASALAAGASPLLAAWLVPVAIGLVAIAGAHGAAAAAALVVTTAAVTGLAHRRLGGYTGDVLGAAGMLGETAALLALAAAR